MSHTHIGLVTGANKGIGLAIVRQLALQYPKSALDTTDDNAGLLIYLTARDKSRGEAAVRSLFEEDAQLEKAKALRGKADGGGWAEIRFQQLDVGDTMSVRGVVEFLRREHGEGGLDFVVNNAGA